MAATPARRRHPLSLRHDRARRRPVDNVGAKGARTEIAAIKVVAPRVALEVIDRAIRVHGGAGVSEDFPLAGMYAATRTLRIADGPDEVHLRDVARRDLRSYLQPT